jgi:hypothetical protein
LDFPDKFPEITEIAGNSFLLDQFVDKGHGQVGFPHPAGPDEQEANILNRIVLHELLGDLDSVFMGIVVNFKIFERTIGISFGNLCVSQQDLTLPFLKTTAAGSYDPSMAVLQDPTGIVANGAGLVCHQFK